MAGGAAVPWLAEPHVRREEPAVSRRNSRRPPASLRSRDASERLADVGAQRELVR